MPPIHVMIKPVSGACNLHCSYCFYADVAAHREKEYYGRMTDETVENLIRRAFYYAQESVSFSFQGGEPVLAGLAFFEHFVRTAESYNTRGLQVNYAVQTNATLLDEAFCRFLSENRFLVGVSLDGTQAVHDVLRSGSYADTVRGIRLLQKHGIPFNILTVVTGQLAADPRGVWEALAPYGYLQFIPCIDGFDGTGAEYSLQAETYADFLIETFECYEKAFFSDRHVSERRFDNYLMILAGERPEMCGMCGQCGLYFLAEADGSIYPCDFYVLDEWKMGNVNETNFRRMAKSETMTAFRSAEIPERCRNCEYFRLCRGGCRRDREGLEVSRFCESYRRFFEVCGAGMMALARQAGLMSEE